MATSMNIRLIAYKDYDITYNFYGRGEYTVHYCGDDLWFMTEKEAMEFIDSVE